MRRTRNARSRKQHHTCLVFSGAPFCVADAAGFCEPDGLVAAPAVNQPERPVPRVMATTVG